MFMHFLPFYSIFTGGYTLAYLYRIFPTTFTVIHSLVFFWYLNTESFYFAIEALAISFAILWGFFSFYFLFFGDKIYRWSEKKCLKKFKK